MSFLLVDYLLGAELLVLLVLHIAQQEDEVAALAWLQGNLDIMTFLYLNYQQAL